MTPTLTESRTDVYRRRARRLRRVYAGDPVRLQRSLSELSRSCDHKTGAACGFANQAARKLREMSSAKAQAAERVILDARTRDECAAKIFAHTVAQRLIGPVLHYDARQELLRTATRMRIGRFEANLIIAAVQHRADRARRRDSDSDPPQTGAGAIFFSAAIVQAMILAGVWWLVY